MRYADLGRTGIRVSACTFGTAGLGGRRDPDEAGNALALALEGGVNALEIDAADAPAVAEMVRRAGGPRDLNILARATSLVRFDLPSPHVTADQAYPGRHLRAETETLLKTLRVERLALQQIHAWCPEWLHEGDWLETLMRLREEGKIAGIGASLFDHDLDSALEVVESGAIDAVQLMRNIFDQGADEALLDLCRAHGVAAIARAPLYYGALAGQTPGDWPAGDWRHAYFYPAHWRETAARVARLGLACEGDDRSVGELALAYAASHPAIATVAVGMLTPAHVRADLAAFDRSPITAERRAALAAHKWLC